MPQDLLTDEDCESLLCKDQLRKQIMEGTAFEVFQEADIQWTPTYKFKGYTLSLPYTKTSHEPSSSIVG